MTFKITPWKEGMEPEAGVCYSGIPNEVYHGFREWYGSSMLKHALRSAESFFYELKQPHKITLALERGGAFHLAMEGLIDGAGIEFYKANVFECPTKTIHTKAWKEIKEENPYCYVLPEKERDNARNMALKTYAKAQEVGLLKYGCSELSFFWIDEDTGIKLKCRTDWLSIIDDKIKIDDYKTSKNHQQDTFEKDVANLRYHLSAAMYAEGVRVVTGIEVESFNYFAIANTPPFEVEYYSLDEASRQEGYSVFRKILMDIHDYEPNAPLTTKTISLPRWAFKMTEPPLL
jgi:hypothetical protein